MIDKVKKILGLSSRKTGNKLILSVEKLESRVALLENGRLEEYSVERSTSRNIVGSIYKGKVRNIEMGLKAMFVDIGFEKNAFLHFWDATSKTNHRKRYTEYLPGRLGCHCAGNQRPDRYKGAAGDYQSQFSGALPGADAVQ